MSENDSISRKAAIDALADYIHNVDKAIGTGKLSEYDCKDAAKSVLDDLPSAQPEQTDCEYCHEDSDGYVRPIEKNSHAWLVRRGRTMKLHICFKGEYRECDILFCPMCGRRLTDG